MKPIVVISLLLIFGLSGGCAPGRDFKSSLKSIVKPYRFSILRWESRAIPSELNRLIFGRAEKVDDEARTVTEYFTLVEQIRSTRSTIEAISRGDKRDDLNSVKAELNKSEERKKALEDAVVSIVGGQIKETLAQQKIFNPLDKYIKLKVIFPPLSFKLEAPPRLLVISPRDRIESMREVTLKQSISLEEVEDIESEVDELGVSSLVVELGGFAGAYPGFATDEAGLRFVLDTATEEWLHQYLAFRPLGFRYLLDLTGVARDYEVATINETVASIVAKEISSLVYGTYYAGGEKETPQQPVEAKFDFDREMREIRRAVDEYLGRGEIEQAEEFMEQKREYLASKGYYIRKLNQAYFAFHGAYADRPTSISPIGLELKQLRSQSASLKDFLDTAAVITSRQGLRDSLK